HRVRSMPQPRCQPVAVAVAIGGSAKAILQREEVTNANQMNRFERVVAPAYISTGARRIVSHLLPPLRTSITEAGRKR
ncbi:MAG TPA: hypothetical protein VFX27_11250, partial [Sphingobium sp.]|nr:hypothetical protein [Sphingobium sp.]